MKQKFTILKRGKWWNIVNYIREYIAISKQHKIIYVNCKKDVYALRAQYKRSYRLKFF